MKSQPMENAAIMQGSTQAGSTTDISKDKLNYFQGMEENGGGIYFILPDQLYIQITYVVIVKDALNSEVIAQNTAALYADYTDSDRKITLVEVGQSGATGKSDPPERLEKTDSVTGPQPAGAGFALYSSDEKSDLVDGTDKIEVMWDREVTLYKLKADEPYTTNAAGAINKITAPDKGGKENLYALVEKASSEGYVLNDEPYFFLFPDYEGDAKSDKVTYTHDDKEVTGIVHQPEENETISVIKEPGAYPFRMVKKDSGAMPLEGAEFALRSSEKTENDENILWVGKSGEDGQIKWHKPGEAESENNVGKAELQAGNRQTSGAEKGKLVTVSWFVT